MNQPDPPFTLTPMERQDPLWLKLRAHMEKRVDQMRRENDGELDDIKTTRLRGRIQALTALIALDRDPPVTE